MGDVVILMPLPAPPHDDGTEQRVIAELSVTDRITLWGLEKIHKPYRLSRVYGEHTRTRIPDPCRAALMDLSRKGPERKDYPWKKAVDKKARTEMLGDWQRVLPDAFTWVAGNALQPSEAALAWLTAGECGSRAIQAPVYGLAVSAALLNAANREALDPLHFVTGDPRGFGYRWHFGSQEGRRYATHVHPKWGHVAIARRALELEDWVGGAERWVNLKMQDFGHHSGKLSLDAEELVQLWAHRGWEWVGDFDLDAGEPAIDPFLLMLFKFVGVGKANAKPALRVVHDGRRRWLGIRPTT